jgi:hypothetical protein
MALESSIDSAADSGTGKRCSETSRRTETSESEDPSCGPADAGTNATKTANAATNAIKDLFDLHHAWRQTILTMCLLAMSMDVEIL